MADEDLAGQAVDLTNCDREPIHIPSRIQPHGLLLVLQEPDLVILQASNNTEDLLGRIPEELLNSNLEALLVPDDLARLEEGLHTHHLDENPLHLLTLKPRGQQRLFDGIAHRTKGGLVLELEPARSSREDFPLGVFYQVKEMMTRLQRTTGLQECCQIAAAEVRTITGFDRVMIYRFAEDEHGSVVAEAKREDLVPYLGLHYPASDIPKQARALYVKNWLRLIADVGYQPAEMTPIANPLTQRLLDMSYCVLRSVSPIHIEYLKNMGVGASMSISLVQDNKLWGLIACHHTTPKYVPYDLRTACELVGQMLSLQLANKQESEDTVYQAHMNAVLTKLVESLGEENAFPAGLTTRSPTVLDLLNATGAAVCNQGECLLLGQTPSKQDVLQLVDWLAEQPVEDVLVTNSLPELSPLAVPMKALASGLLALCISANQRQYVLWFRPEVAHMVRWAGDPHKPVEETEDGLRLSPRKSFELWKQTVRFHSERWLQAEVEATRMLRHAIITVVLRNAAELARLNAELEQEKTERETFISLVAHELRTPLTVILGQAQLLEGAAGATEARRAKGLGKIREQTNRLHRLVADLQDVSRITAGTFELAPEPVELSALAQSVVEEQQATTQRHTLRLEAPAEPLMGRWDSQRLAQVLNNLLSNAIKYSEGGEVRVTLQQSGDVVQVAVQDQGAGMTTEEISQLFQLSGRLERTRHVAAGAGLGLFLTQGIIAAHGGRIWASSHGPGQGSSFTYTLPLSSRTKEES